MECIGSLPIVDNHDQDDDQSVEGSQKQGKPSQDTRRLNPDGTYATETALTTLGKNFRDSDVPILRELVLKGEYEVAVALGSTLTKLALNFQDCHHRAQAMLIITSIIRAGLSQVVASQIDKDSYDRLILCVRTLAKPSPALEEAFKSRCRKAFESHLLRNNSNDTTTPNSKSKVKIDERIQFRIPGAQKGSSLAISADYWTKDLALAVSTQQNEPKFMSVLSKVVQLTGFSDEIYAECYVTISHADIILDILLVNQVEETLQNVSIDLSTSGDLKVTEKPAPINLAPLGFAVIKAGVKVRSTDNGVIFGSISYGITDIQTIVLNSISIDICEYIRPDTVPDSKFRNIWTTLEWENKINVPAIANSQLDKVLSTILDGSHMACITENYGISESGDYLASNLYACSVFGEEILANICLERSPLGVVGHLRLRSKTQGIAVALGDRLTDIVNKMQ